MQTPNQGDVMATNTKLAPPKAFLRVTTIAAMLDCSKGHIWNMLKDSRYGFPPAIKLSRQVTVFDAALVANWIEERRGQKAKEQA